MTKENAPLAGGAGYSVTTKASSTTPIIRRPLPPPQPEPPAAVIYRGQVLNAPERIDAETCRYMRKVARHFPDRRLYVAPWLFVQRNFAIHVLHAPNWPRMGRSPGYRYRGFARLDIGDELQEKDIVTE